MAAYKRGSIKLFFGSKNLVGYYPLYNNLDYSGNNKHGIPQGSVVFRKITNNQYKNFDVGFYGDGNTTAYLQLPSFWYTYANQLSIVGWFRKEGTTSEVGEWECIFGHGSGVTSGTVNVYCHESNGGPLRFYIINSSGAGVVLDIGQIYYNKIYNFVFTWDGSLMKGYLNGNFAGSASQTGTLLDISNYSIGQAFLRSSGYQYQFNGFIFEIGVFNRVLSPQEIKSYYKWATGQKKVLPLSKIFFFSESSFLISGQTISQIKTQNSTTFSLSVSESNKLKTFPSSSIQFLTTANSKREIPKQLIKDIKTEKINFDITNQP